MSKRPSDEQLNEYRDCTQETGSGCVVSMLAVECIESRRIIAMVTKLGHGITTNDQVAGLLHQEECRTFYNYGHVDPKCDVCLLLEALDKSGPLGQGRLHNRSPVRINVKTGEFGG